MKLESIKIIRHETGQTPQDTDDIRCSVVFVFGGMNVLCVDDVVMNARYVRGQSGNDIPFEQRGNGIYTMPLHRVDKNSKLVMFVRQIDDNGALEGGKTHIMTCSIGADGEPSIRSHAVVSGMKLAEMHKMLCDALDAAESG